MDSQMPDRFYEGMVRVKRHDINLGLLPSYLFEPSSPEFAEPALEMAKLNNYALTRRLISDPLGGSDPSIEDEVAKHDPNIEEWDLKCLIAFQDQYAVELDDYIGTVNKASILIFLYCWFIKSLKDISRRCEPSVFHENMKKGAFQRNELGTVLEILDLNTKGKASLSFNSAPIKHVLDKVRAIRNNFAHGEWDKIEEDIRGLILSNVFKSISDVLRVLETVCEPNTADPRGPREL